MSMFSIVRDAIIGGGMVWFGKIVTKIALALGGTFLLSEFVLTPAYDAILGAITAAGNGGDMAAWLALARVPDIINVLFAGMGVRAAQKVVFKKVTSGGGL